MLRLFKRQPNKRVEIYWKTCSLVVWDTPRQDLELRYEEFLNKIANLVHASLMHVRMYSNVISMSNN